MRCLSEKVSSTDSAKVIKKIDNGEVVVNKKCGNGKKGESKNQKTKSNPKSFEVEINKWGDVHFKKAIKESALKYAKIKPLQELRMTFKKGPIVLTAVS